MRRAFGFGLLAGLFAGAAGCYVALVWIGGKTDGQW
jgi:hypothetical protein